MKKDDVVLSEIPRGTDLFKAGEPNFNPHQPRNHDPRSHWSGTYASESRRVADGYGEEHSFNRGNTKKVEYDMNRLRVDSKLYAVEVKNPSFADGSIPGDAKAKGLNYYLRDHGLGRYENVKSDDPPSRRDFERLSNRVRDTFQTDHTRLMTGLDQNRLAYKGPHDVGGDTEIALRDNTMGKLTRYGNSEHVIRN